MIIKGLSCCYSKHSCWGPALEVSTLRLYLRRVRDSTWRQGFSCSFGSTWVLPPLINSWKIYKIWLHGALSMTPIIHCYWVGAGPTVAPHIPITPAWWRARGLQLQAYTKLTKQLQPHTRSVIPLQRGSMEAQRTTLTARASNPDLQTVHPTFKR